MTSIVVHGFHRLSDFLSGQKVTKKPPGPHSSRTLLYSSRFLEGFRHPCPFDWQLYEASGSDRRYSSMNRGGAFRRPASNVGVRSLGVKA